jgi:sulfur relay (sulfurtransferase) DsrC/TusE family protein
MKHVARIEAEKKVASAASAMRRAEMGTDESAYLAAAAAWKASVAELVAAEMAHPTARESSRRANIIRLENRGLAA